MNRAVGETPNRSRLTIHDSRLRARRACLVLAAAAATWAVLAFVTGGVSLHLGSLRLSSRHPLNPALIGVILVATAALLAPAGRRLPGIAADLRWLVAIVHHALDAAWRRWTTAAVWLETRLPAATAPVIVVTVVAALMATSVRETAFVAAASDAFGYVSQAHMWATWTLRLPQPLMAEMGGFLPREAMAPLAFRPSPEGMTIVPVTSPGLPMLMALFEALAGPMAVFAVAPLLAGLAVWATYLLGRELHGRWTGVVAAVLLAASPAFLFQLTSSPMSDIPAAAWWTLSLVFALRRNGGSALRSGLCAGVAVLIRANLVPIAIVPAAMVFYRTARTGRDRHEPGGDQSAFGGDGRTPIRAGAYGLLAFAGGVLPAAAFIALLYDYWYGSPLNSGYGTLPQLYSPANVLPNLSRYAQWLPESQTPVVFAALAAPLLARNRPGAVGLLTFVLAVVACYVFYIPFDAWWYLRFLLPAFPAMLVLASVSIVSAAARLPHQVRAVAVAALVGLIARQTIGYAAARATFDTGGEQKYAITGRYVADHLPRNAVIFSELHSGGIRYYGNRTTIRFGLIPSDHLEGAVAELERIGYAPYLVAEDWEVDSFRRQFAGRGIVSMLVDPPIAELPLGHVRIYPLAR